MSDTNKNQQKCDQLWDGINSELKGALNLWVYGTTGDHDALSDLKKHCAQVQGDQVDKNILDKWEQVLNTLKEKNANFNKIEQIQQVGTTNVALAATLGPAAGVGAGLSLFPLLTKFLKK